MKKGMRLLLIVITTVLLLSLSIPVYAQTTVDSDVGGLDGFGRPPSRHSFFAEGLIWSTYVDTAATDWVYRTSDDYGSTWSGETVLFNSITYAFNCSLYYDGTYVHLVRATGTGVWYRRATPNSDGSLTYSAVWQQAVSVGTNTHYPTVAVDANGYPFICYYITYGAPAFKYYVTRSDNNDGTWSTSASHPHELVGSNDGYVPLIVPMASGRMLALYGKDGATLRAQMWSGAAWGSEDATTSLLLHRNYSAVNVDDTVHIVFTEDTSEDLIYTTYTSAASDFGSETTIDNSGAGASSKAGSITINTDNNDMYIIAQQCPTADHVYYFKYDAGTSTWGSAVDWIDETVLDGLPVNQFLQDTNYTTDGGLAYFYLADPRHLKFKSLATLEIATLPATTITASAATLRGEITSLGTGAVDVRGFEYGISGGSITTVSESGAFGVGVFSQTLSTLESDELYVYRAYATDDSGTIYGDWVYFITLMSGAEPTQPDEPDEGMHPPIPTTGPENWINTTKTYDSFVGSDLINTFADTISRSFVWFLLMLAGLIGIGLLVCKFSRHLGISFVLLGIYLGVFIGGGYLDWWIMLPYLIVGIALIVREYQYSWA